MFGKSKGNAADNNRDSSSAQEVKRSAVASAAPEASSSISAGLSIVGKIVGQGRLSILGHVEGEVHASTVQIGDGAQVEGNIVAEELTIGGRGHNPCQPRQAE
jgi:cytoskeletal protein CcmA (bactofilin family)